MFLPMIDLPAVEYVAFQPKCEERLAKEEALASGNRPCPENCWVASISGEPSQRGYRDYFLGFPVCYKCWVPRGQGVVATNFNVYKAFE
jgi:hypothetical protein